MTPELEKELEGYMQDWKKSVEEDDAAKAAHPVQTCADPPLTGKKLATVRLMMWRAEGRFPFNLLNWAFRL